MNPFGGFYLFYLLPLRKVADFDHSSPELIDLFIPGVYICYHADYIFEHQTGQMWSRIPGFAANEGNVSLQFRANP
jgi:hypothetical protein